MSRRFTDEQGREFGGAQFEPELTLLAYRLVAATKESSNNDGAWVVVSLRPDELPIALPHADRAYAIRVSAKHWGPRGDWYSAENVRGQIRLGFGPGDYDIYIRPIQLRWKQDMPPGHGPNRTDAAMLATARHEALHFFQSVSRAEGKPSGFRKVPPATRPQGKSSSPREPSFNFGWQEGRIPHSERHVEFIPNIESDAAELVRMIEIRLSRSPRGTKPAVSPDWLREYVQGRAKSRFGDFQRKGPGFRRRQRYVQNLLRRTEQLLWQKRGHGIPTRRSSSEALPNPSGFFPVDAKRGYIEITEAIESVAALQDVYGSIYAAWQRSRTQLKAAKAETAKLQENYARVTESLNGWRRSSLRAGQQMEALKEELRVASNKLHQCQVDVGACRADLTLLHAEHKAQKTALPKVLSKKDKRARDREMRAQQKTGGKRSSRRQR